VLLVLALTTLIVAFTTTLIFAHSSHAIAGTTKTINFQGRLLTAAGAVVPDGTYNIQFKIYQGGTGVAAGNPDGALEWTETYANTGTTTGVSVKDGFLSVNLGSINPFGTSVDWNQDNLWLSMNVAGSATGCSTFGTAPCSADGEMLPMKQITATPYSINSGQLGGITSAGFIQNTTTQQTADFTISGTGIAGILQANTGVITPIVDTLSIGTLSLGTTNATGIDIATNNIDHIVNIASGTANQSVTIGSTSGTSGLTLQGGTSGVSVNTNAGFIVHNNVTSTNSLAIDGLGNAAINLSSSTSLNVVGTVGTVLQVGDTGTVSLGSNSHLVVDGSATFNQAISLAGTGSLTNSGLSFAGTGASTVASATGQALNLNGASGVNIQNNGVVAATFGSNVQIGTGAGTGSPTLLTLDNASSAPSLTGSAMNGSMYYDTTLGQVQCYEAGAWGKCTASPDDFVSLSPQYSNAVMHGSTTGTMTSDLCSDALNINDGSSSQPTICAANETYNYYNWTSSSATAQTRSIYVTYQLPSNFKNFVAGSTSLAGLTDTTDANVAYQLYKNTATGLVACGTTTSVSTGAHTNWQKATAAGTADPSSCNFAAGDSVVFKIDLTSANSANAYASTLNFAFSNN
jgi:hypothetical protein